MDNMRASIGSVYYPAHLQEVAIAEVATLSITVKPRHDELPPREPSGRSLRRRIVFDTPEEVIAPPAKQGFFKRLFAKA